MTETSVKPLLLRTLSSCSSNLPVCLFLVTILVIIGWGFSSLYLVFSHERDNAAAEIVSRQKALEHYAFLAFSGSLQQQLSLARVNLENILRDPLIDSRNILYFIRHDDNQTKKSLAVQVLPRPTDYRPSREGDQSAIDLYQELLDKEPVDLLSGSHTTRYERLSLLADFKLAVETQDAETIRWALRDIRGQRARSTISADFDIPYVLSLLQYLITFSEPEQTMVKTVIRNGAIIEQEYGRYGLQRLLLANRNLFSKREFEFFRDITVSLSRQFDAEYTDFLQQSNVNNGFVVLDFNRIVQPSLLHGGQWYVEKQYDRSVLGVRINPHHIISEIDKKMKLSGMLPDTARVQLVNLTDAINILHKESNVVSVSGTGVIQRLEAVTDNFRLKTLLLISGVFLVVTIMIITAVGQFRKQRFLSLKSDFISTVSHELKTPLASIRLLTETLSDKADKSGKYSDYPARIIKTTDEMTYLVDNILAFNRLNKDLWQLKKSRFNLVEFLSSLKYEFNLYTERPLHIEVQYEDETEVNADRSMLKILFGNLIINACKYNEHEVAEIAIKVSLEKRIVVDVTDNGNGIPEDKWQSVFDEFIRAVNTDRKTVSGAGLGLSICRIIMQRHEGSIKIVRSDDAGTTLRLEFNRE